jgi:putative membrane protein insertion efficiency factor
MRLKRSTDDLFNPAIWPYLYSMTPLAHLLALPVRAYRLLFSPWVGFNCRYQPTCSAYSLEAFEKHGAVKGAWLTVRRIGRCHPWGGDGYDPVPDSPQHNRPKGDQ